MLSRPCIQLMTLLSVLVGNFIAGLLPLCIIRVIGRFSADDQTLGRTKRTVALLVHFGGGVVLSVCMLLLIPESQDYFQNHETQSTSATEVTAAPTQETTEGHHDGFPIPEFVVLCGFFATFAIEELVKYLLLYFRSKSTTNVARVRFCSCAKRHTECSRTYKAENPDQTMFGMEKQRYLGENVSTEGEFSGLKRSSEPVVNVNSSLLRSSIISQPVPTYGSVANMTDAATDQPVLSQPLILAHDVNLAIIRHHQNQCIHIDITSNIFLLIVLSVYAIIQGLSVGHIMIDYSWAIIFTRCLQQTILIFVAGSVILADTEKMWPIMSYVGALCVMYLFGISIPMFYGTEVISISSKVWGITMCCICGSLLYLTFCDLLRRDILKKAPGFQKFAFFSMGAAVVAGVIYLPWVL